MIYEIVNNKYILYFLFLFDIIIIMYNINNKK